MSSATTSVTIPLPGGQSARMRDPETITGIETETVLGLADAEGVVNVQSIAKSQMLRMMGMLRRALVVTLAESWTLVTPDGEPVPITMATVGTQPMKVLRPLYAHVAPALAEIMPGGDPDPNSVSGS